MTDRASVIYRVPTDGPVAFITIDDGYATDPQATEYVQSNALPVTQFLTYYAATQGALDPPPSSPGALNVAELRKYQTGTGEQRRVGCHHKQHLDYRGQTVAEQQGHLSAAADWLGDLFSARPRLFRPPYGQYDNATLQAAWGAGLYKLVLWTHVVADGRVANEYGSPRLRAGDVLLLHHPATAGQDGTLLADLQAALAAITAANLVPAYLHKHL